MFVERLGGLLFLTAQRAQTIARPDLGQRPVIALDGTQGGFHRAVERCHQRAFRVLLDRQQDLAPAFIEPLPDVAEHQQRRQVVLVDGSQTVARLLQAIGTEQHRQGKQQGGQQRPEPQALGDSNCLEHDQWPVSCSGRGAQGPQRWN
ncbi:hypothetical protein D3C76_1288160 [compost metagenome]